MTNSQEMSSRYKFLNHLGQDVGFQFITVSLEGYLTAPLIDQFGGELAE